MNNDFKKATYLAAVIIFLLGILALVGVSAANYFSYDDSVVMVGELVAIVAFFALFIVSVLSKSKYNRACVRFAEYILNNRKKDADKRASDAETAKDIQSIREAAARERDQAVAAALEQGRNEGTQAAMRDMASRMPMAAPMTAPAAPMAAPAAPIPTQISAAPVAAMPTAAAVPQPVNAAVNQQPEERAEHQMPTPPYPAAPYYPQPVSSNEEMLYNEYGEPVMIRRRVRKSSAPMEGDVLYDSYGNPVIRRSQGFWEVVEPRREIVVKLETNPNTTAFVTNVETPGKNPANISGQ